MTNNVEEAFREAEAGCSGSENPFELEEEEESSLARGGWRRNIGILLLATISFALILFSFLRSIGLFEGGVQ
jgi:hypothetical protein